MRPNEEQLKKLAQLLDATVEHEIDCDEMLDRVAAYLKALTDKSALPDRLQQVAQHLSICPECREEFRALIRAEGLDPKSFQCD